MTNFVPPKHVEEKASLVLRQLQNEDSTAMWDWRNDHQTKQMSLHTNAVSWDEHHEWFASVMQDASQTIYLGLLKTEAPQNEDFVPTGKSSNKVGMVRFDCASWLKAKQVFPLTIRKKSTCKVLVSVNLNPEFRKCRLSVLFLNAAIRQFLQDIASKMAVKKKVTFHFDAIIKTQNLASIKVFEKLGFVKLISNTAVLNGSYKNNGVSFSLPHKDAQLHYRYTVELTAAN